MRRPAILWAGMMILAVGIPQLACGQDDVRVEDARSSFRAGRYAEAIDLSRAFLRANPEDRAVRRILVESLTSIGHYDEAVGEATALPTAKGRALLELGRVEEAEAEFNRAVQQNDPDRLTAELNLAILLYERGEVDEAMQRFDRFIDVYNDSDNLSAADLTAVGTAVRYLAIRDHQLFQDALKAYDEAVAADPEFLEPRLLLGELFLDRYDSPQAQEAFLEVLAINSVHPRALVGMARAKQFDGDTPEAFELATKALEINYQSVPARVLLARLTIDSENPVSAEQEIEEALKVNPRSLEALSMLAAIRFLQGDDRRFGEVRDRVLGFNPRYAPLYVTLAELAAQHRRYAQAADFARRAVELDSSAWAGYGALGLNQLRLGQVEEARASLERSFDGDPYNAWIKNTLDLLDTFGDYELRTSPRFVYMLHGEEAGLLYPYISQLAEEAYDDFARRYGYEPETPIRIEVYPRHADFSVRTVGLTGLGALGVAFGNVLALISPSATEAGEVNWGSTLWHELGHTMALGMSNNRVPRWFTEGLSVVEERKARPGWGSETTADFMMAYDATEIPPVSRLNEGFTRPASPQHLGLAYHMASLVVEWIEETHGFDAIVGMLRAYGEGMSTQQAFRRVLREDPETMDDAFDRWLRAKYPKARVEAYTRALNEASELYRAGEQERAKQKLLPVLDVFGGADPTPHAMLGRIYLEQGDTAAALASFARVAEIDENAYGTNGALAELATARRDPAQTAAAFERIMYIYPFEIEDHRRLATLYAEIGDWEKAVREREAVVALEPVDRAEALYQLAVALRAAGKPQEARAQVIRALEAAPAFERAQELLLELSGSSGGT
ncbi:MAG TPA: tetratricopeptide repeat protein [Longimicrobiaceae bacterium]